VRFTQFYNQGPSAFTDGQDITFFGDFSQSHSVFVHEATHNLDRWIAGDSNNWYSYTDAWRSWTNTQDSCVPDGYAMASYTEDFAQTGVLVAYDANVAPLHKTEGASDCFKTQYARAGKEIRKTWKYDAGRRCKQRIQEE